MNESFYYDGTEVHVGDHLDHLGQPAIVVLVVQRGEETSGFTLVDWADQGNILIQEQTGELFMYESFQDEDCIHLVTRASGLLRSNGADPSANLP